MITYKTDFGWMYYERGLGKVYFRPGDPEIGSFRGDDRSPDQRREDQIAGEAAERNWLAAQESIAFVKRQEHQKAEAELQRIADWESLFHPADELEKAPAFTFAIDSFLQEKGTTMIGAKSGDGKTLIAMEMAKCLLTGEPLFGHFKVNAPAKKVVYLIPESGLSPFALRCRIFGLIPFARDKKFYARTLDSRNPNASITDAAILKACEGADVFLDTAVRFMTGDENSASDSKLFADNLFALIGRTGARTVTGLHHAPKAFEKAQYMSLENILRGSGDIGAMLATCWGMAQIDRKITGIRVENVKARDFEPCDPFNIAGRPSINETGHFEMTAKPGLAGSYQQQKPANGRPKTDDKVIAQAWLLHRAGKSHREIAAQLKVGKSTIGEWLAGKCPEAIE